MGKNFTDDSTVMDIRKATKAAGSSGTEPPKTVAAPTDLPPIPEVDTETGITISQDVPADPGDVVIKQYLEYLEQNGITQEDIRDVLDAIVTGGNVVWDFELYGRIPVHFTIRPAWVNDYVLRLIDDDTSDSDKVSMVRYNSLVAVCNLAASMVRFGDEKYDIRTKEDIVTAMERVRNLPYVTQTALVNKLAVFDRTVALATSDWAVKNFTTPQTAK